MNQTCQRPPQFDNTAVYREQATFYTDRDEVYKGVIPSAQHRAISKLAHKTNHVERFNCTLRQRVSRLAGLRCHSRRSWSIILGP